MIQYVHIVETKAYYKAQLDCCYEIVSYDDKNLGITSKIDQDGDNINSYDLICRCYPDKEIIEISEEEYYVKRKEVYDLMNERTSKN